MQSPLPGPGAQRAGPGSSLQFDARQPLDLEEKCPRGNLNVSLNHFSPISSLGHEAKNGAIDEY